MSIAASDGVDPLLVSDNTHHTDKASCWQLFLAGFLILFLELACIRWLAVYVIFLQFFTNIILVACFLGMSIGCLCAQSPTDWMKRFPQLIAYTTLLAYATHTVYFYWSDFGVDVAGGSMQQVVYFGTEQKKDIAKFFIPVELLAGIFFVLITLTFVGPGQVLGRLFNSYPDRVVAYTANILGSLAGIACFALASLLESNPIWWFAASFMIVLYFMRQAQLINPRSLFYLGCAMLSVGLASTTLRNNEQVHWSPYYSIFYNENTHEIKTNSISHQCMQNRSKEGPEYSLIHYLNRDAGGDPFEQVMVIGAGSGNDVTHCLANGATHIDAVEIDPVIQSLGAQYHPNNPYSDPRVTVHINDGRNFLRTTDKKYDLVVFALVDSLILHSSYSSVRLESFLFTEQAFGDVGNVLAEDGVFVMYNYFRQGWVVERISNMLETAMGQKPIVISLPYLEEIRPEDTHHQKMTMFIVGNTSRIEDAFERHGEFRLAHTPPDSDVANGFEQRAVVASADDDTTWHKIAPARVVASTTGLAPATDDWPFLYLAAPSLPWLYVRGMIMIAAISLGVLWWLSPGRKVALNGRMFFLGAGFLLLETKAVVHLALVFGSTWLVNSLVFSSILVMILLANLYVMRQPKINLTPYYAGLLICLVINCVVPLDVFLAGGVFWKYITPCLITICPMFFAGVIFAVSFRESQTPDADFGANIAGAVVGGLAEYASMLVGFRYLLLIAIVFYLCSAIFKPRLQAKLA